MARRLAGTGTAVRFSFEGMAVEASAGDTVAAALLAAGHRNLRASAVSGAPRGPYCLMGACFDCMVSIDGVAGRQACMTEVAPGMDVRRMAAILDDGEG
ncbi:MAG: (2Fe-2S)-binding protein [Rhodobacteraceae bacterium]|jgi:predicted molibdopterin-dependent oxidoreductase YjgC|nr:(2Fe-2S)-binding protein [Paracoccaceae bacterium]